MRRATDVRRFLALLLSSAAATAQAPSPQPSPDVVFPADVEQVTAPVALDDREHPWQSYVITLDPEVDRGAVATYLRQHGIQCNFGTYASHQQPVYGFSGTLPVSADLFRRHLAIPMHANLTQHEVERVVATLKDAIAASR